MSYQSDTEIENLVRSFEACETAPAEFKHREHLVVAIWYLETAGREAAVDLMRSSLKRFLDHFGVDQRKYSEATTVFWIAKVAEKLNELGPGVTLAEKCNTIVESADFRPQIFADRNGMDS